MGEKLGVTNKTVSRWENGNYLQPVEMLQLLSKLYDITINEILSGEKLTEEQYRDKAEENIKSTLSASAFTLKEKIDFYKKKWKKDHLFETVFGIGLVILLYVMGSLWGGLWSYAAALSTIGFASWYRNAMMTYVEDRVFGEKQGR